MPASSTVPIAGTRGEIVVHHVDHPDPTVLVLLAHGLGEHVGRYAHVVDRLSAEGAVVVAPDHWGHGLSGGDRALTDDIDAMAADLALVAEDATADHSELPVVLIGHSLGGMIATRYAQTHPGTLVGLVLSGPVIGGNDALLGLLDLPEIPDVPIDPAALSRDPAVGEAYAADPLVYHGPMQRGTLEGVRDAVTAITDGGGLGDLPTLWVHGEEDQLAPVAETQRAFDVIGGSDLTRVIYPGAQHEVFNETNAEEVLDEVCAFIRRVTDRA